MKGPSKNKRKGGLKSDQMLTFLKLGLKTLSLACLYWLKLQVKLFFTFYEPEGHKFAIPT